MNNKLNCFLCLLLAIIITGQLFAQDSLKITQVTDKYVAAIEGKSDRIQQQLDKRTKKLLKKMVGIEARLQKQLAKVDSAESQRLFGKSAETYKSWESKLSSSPASNALNGSQYLAYMDTLKTSLSFLDQSALTGQASDKMKSVQEELGNLQSKFDQTAAFQQFLKERRQYLKERLSSFGMGRQLKSMGKEVFYYSQALKDYKEVFKDRKKAEQKALSLLRESTAFKKFMQKNSQLASMFGLASAGGPNVAPASMAGLQTRASIQQQLAATAIPGGNAQQFLTQQLQTANQQLSGQKNPIRFPELQDNLGEMPDFKPNRQKTKSFLQRLEYGFNIQFGKTNNFLPSTGEVAATLGYKLNDNGTVGTGISYKLGLGSGFNHIRFSSQGYGLRSFVDWKIKGSIYVSGGYERNYLPGLSNMEVGGQALSGWQESGLIGVMKKYAIGKKKKGTIQILFDFLSYKNVPRSRPILFRTGFNF